MSYKRIFNFFFQKLTYSKTICAMKIVDRKRYMKFKFTVELPTALSLEFKHFTYDSRGIWFTPTSKLQTRTIAHRQWYNNNIFGVWFWNLLIPERFHVFTEKSIDYKMIFNDSQRLWILIIKELKIELPKILHVLITM